MNIGKIRLVISPAIRVFLAACVATVLLARPASADVASCQACCNNDYNFCSTFYYYNCAVPAIQSCEQNGGDPGTCTFNAFYGVCYPEFTGCEIQQGTCLATCQSDPNSCTY